MEPSLNGVSYGWNGNNIVSDQELFRNSLVYSTKLLATTQLFNKLVFKFTANNPDDSAAVLKKGLGQKILSMFKKKPKIESLV